jgi:hypothetical protein
VAAREEVIFDEVYEFEARIRFRIRAGGPRDAILQRERMRSHIQKLNDYTRRKLGLEIEIAEWTEPEMVDREARPLSSTRKLS